jgi:hypothetical protein
MNNLQIRVINERSKNIPIQKSPTRKITDNETDKEYSLKQNFFDPFKNSPPNEFMLKLQLRMSLHESFINDDKRSIA